MLRQRAIIWVTKSMLLGDSIFGGGPGLCLFAREPRLFAMALEFRHTAMHKEGKNLTLVYHSKVPEDVLQAQCLRLSGEQRVRTGVTADVKCIGEHLSLHRVKSGRQNLATEVVRSPCRAPKAW